MISHNLMNINLEAYKHSDAPSRSMWRLNDIIPIIFIIYTHNFYTDGKPEFLLLKYMLLVCKDPSSYS